MKTGDTALYTLPPKEGGHQISVNLVDSVRGSFLIRVELIRHKPDFRWVGESELKPIPPAASENTIQQELFR
jgi:hypothetical protein